MTKILSRNGDSLADTYDVQGSVAGIEQLMSSEVTLVHEMGHTIFSERVSGVVRRATTGVLTQSTVWDIVLTNLPQGPFRILGVLVLANIAARVSHASVNIQQEDGEREVPVFGWDVTFDDESSIRIVENGAPSGGFLQLRPGFVQMPNMGIGNQQPQATSNISFRGSTSAFGAGQVIVTMLMSIAFSQIGGISSRGLPIPGW